MRNRKGYTRTALSWPDGRAHPEALVCDQYPHLGVTDAVEQAGWYWVVHVPSGNLAAIVEGQDRALSLIAALGVIEGLDVAAPSKVALLEALGAIEDWRETQVPKQRKLPKPLAVKLEVAYNPGVTPSRAARAADAELAALLGRMMGGDASVTEEEYVAVKDRAFLLGWREALMAEVKQTLANPDELPQAPYRLVDGTPCTWEGWREEYKQLVMVGNDLQVVAVELLDLADTLADLDRRPTRDERAAWDALNDRWLALIAEGWRHWGRAVSHLLASGPVRQQQVEQKLGYIGNRERGWGALGQKTFLRHPEIAEASKARRMVQLAREQRRSGHA